MIDVAARRCGLVENGTNMSVGERAVLTPELLRVLRKQYGLCWRGEVVDLGGSVNLNIHLPAENDGFVACLYAP
jgi:hypothetical protein